MAHVTPSRIPANGLSAKTRHAFHLPHQLIDGNPRTASQVERSRNSLAHSGQIVRVCHVPHIDEVSCLFAVPKDRNRLAKHQFVGKDRYYVAIRVVALVDPEDIDRKSTRLNSS